MWATGRKHTNKAIDISILWINPVHNNLQNSYYLLTKFTMSFLAVLNALEVKDI